MRASSTVFVLLVACNGDPSPSQPAQTEGGTGDTGATSGMSTSGEDSGSTSAVVDTGLDSSGTDGGESSGSSGEEEDCWSQRIPLGEIDDTFGGFFSPPQGVVAQGGEVWIGYGVFGSITPGFGYRLYRGSGDTFESVELPHTLLYGAELFDAPTPTVAVTRWSEGVGVQVWRWIDEAWVVEDVAPSGETVVGDVADDGTTHLMYSLFDDTVMYATDASGAWEVEPVPGAFRPLALTMHTGEPLALVMTSVFDDEPTSIASRDGDMWAFTSTGVTQSDVGRVHGEAQFLQLDNEDDSVWLIDATEPAAPVLVGGEGLYTISDGQWDGDVLRMGWRDFEDIVRVEFSGGMAQTEIITMSADEGPGTVAGDPHGLIWSQPSAVYASCPR